MINKYIIRSHISEAKTREVIRLFASDIEAIKIAELTGLSRNAVNRLFKALRMRIAAICEQESIFAQGCVEVEESYFGARRVRGIRGRGARGQQVGLRRGAVPRN